MRPDLLIVGDSHSAALHEAALARGMHARMLYVNGNFWHENRMRPHPQTGLSAAYRRRLNMQVSGFAQQVGGTVFPPDVPVLASFGYHLGRLTPPFARFGHTPDAGHAATDDSRLFVSAALCDAMIAHHRGALLRILRLAARVSPVVVIAPPVIQTDPTTGFIAARITDLLRKAQVPVFDPRDEPGWAGPLADHWRAADGVHGNAAYGEAVLAHLFDRGLVRPPAA